MFEEVSDSKLVDEALFCTNCSSSVTLLLLLIQKLSIFDPVISSHAEIMH